LLRRSIGELAREQRALEIAAARIGRLDQIRNEVVALEQELARCGSDDNLALGRWHADGATAPRPGPSPATVAAEARLAALAEDVRAIAAVEAAERKTFEAAAKACADARQSRDAAIYEACVEVASHMAETELRDAVVALRTAEERIAGLLSELQRRNDRGDNAAGRARERVFEVLRRTRQAIPPVPPTDWGKELLEGLAGDPAYEMGLTE
jgi:hypothetical protein